MAEALSHLPQAHRDVLVLRYFQGLTEAEIASELGIPKGTVKSRVHHALRKLRDALQGDAT
jgi:RNA polymerase sigma-70 factor (ECF subfamily)